MINTFLLMKVKAYNCEDNVVSRECCYRREKQFSSLTYEIYSRFLGTIF